MGTLCSPFYYDIVASLNSEKDLYSVYSEYKKQNAGKKVLGVTYNHRTFNLHEKNYIKALIDHFNFDHLMFSLRPSAIQLVKQNRNIDLNKFRAITQVVFVLQTMARYEISTGLISSKYLELDIENSGDAIVVLDKVISYLNDFALKISERYK